MLDIRPSGYVSPVSEVDFASVPLIARITNHGNEPGNVTGSFTIYNDDTGLLIFTSHILPLLVQPGVTVDVPALTDFDPPAPADNKYFACFVLYATSTLIPSRKTTEYLTPFYFDVKPVGMGPAPAAHGVTHESGGSDELDVTGLSGELADLQPPKNHASSHESGGSDELDVTGLSGALADDQPAQAHDIEKHLHTKLYFVNDCLGQNAVNQAPWNAAAINSGTFPATAGSGDHPGILRLTSSTSANSGAYILMGVSSFLLKGSCRCDAVVRTSTLAGTTVRFGFHDSASSTTPTDGAYIFIDPVTNLLTGRTFDNSAGSVTGTSYAVTTPTWYRLRVQVNTDATRVDFYVFDEAGNTLWTDNLTTNIPTTAGRETGNGIVATNSGTTAVSLVDVDMIDLEINRALIR